MKSFSQIHRDELRIQVMTANPIEASEGDAWYDKAADVFHRVSHGKVITYVRENIDQKTQHRKGNHD